jgi:hypothetical protein
MPGIDGANSGVVTAAAMNNAAPNTNGLRRPMRSESQPDAIAATMSATKVIDASRAIMRFASP